VTRPLGASREEVTKPFCRNGSRSASRRGPSREALADLLVPRGSPTRQPGNDPVAHDLPFAPRDRQERRHHQGVELPPSSWASPRRRRPGGKNMASPHRTCRRPRTTVRERDLLAGEPNGARCHQRS
jgi:hypothetical protein